MNPASLVHFLLVEDDSIDARGLERGLRASQISNPLSVASDGLEALEILRGTNGKARLPRPYVILLDLNMPRMNGIEFLEELRNDPDLQSSIVFVLTTSNDDEDLLNAYDHFIAGYILKSDAGANFLKVVQLLEHFILTVHFPPEKE